MPAFTFVVDRREAGQTLAAVLKKRLNLTWSQAKRLIEGRHVRVSNQIESNVARRLKPGKQVSIAPGVVNLRSLEGHNIPDRKGKPVTLRPASGDLQTPQRLVDKSLTRQTSQGPPPGLDPGAVIYHDDAIVVVNKPAGLTTMRHRSEAEEFGPRARRFLPPTVAELLPRLLGHPHRFVLAVHRLDRDTSGLVVFARTIAAQRHLMAQFREHTIDRRYLALTRGVPQDGKIVSVIVRDRGDGRRGSVPASQAAPPGGKRAVTHVALVEALGQFALVECRLETGRTHQVRIHLGEIGTPLCGERIYDRPIHGKPLPDGSRASRPMLHAYRLGFTHPVTHERLLWEVSPPDDFEQLLASLRQRSRHE